MRRVVERRPTQRPLAGLQPCHDRRPQRVGHLVPLIMPIRAGCPPDASRRIWTQHRRVRSPGLHPDGIGRYMEVGLARQAMESMLGSVPNHKRHRVRPPLVVFDSVASAPAGRSLLVVLMVGIYPTLDTRMAAGDDLIAPSLRSRRGQGPTRALVRSHTWWPTATTVQWPTTPRPPARRGRPWSAGRRRSDVGRRVGTCAGGRA